MTSYQQALDDMACSIDNGHALGCPCRAGGDPIYRCDWCRRDTSDGDYVRISRDDGSVGRCCSVCYERGDEGVDIGLDMTEDVLA